MRRSGVALLLDFLCLGNPSPVDAADAAAQWRVLRGKPGLRRLLQYEGAELWLHRRLRALGITSESPLDEALRRAAHRDTILGLRIDDEAVATLSILGEASVPCVLLKGQARRAAKSLYPWADARPSSDVDLLLPADRAQEAWDRLVAAGYTHAVDPDRSYRDHFHLPPVWGDRKVAVELHTSTAREVSQAEAWRRATDRADVVTWSGVTATVPSATELLWHGLSHAFIHGHPTRLRTLLDGAAILAPKREIDWDGIRSRMASDEVREAETGATIPFEVQGRWLAAAASLAGAVLPRGLGRFRPIPTGRLLRWRRLVLGAAIGQRARERLIEEAARCELDAGLAPAHPRTPRWRRARHALAATVARASYRGWRTFRA